MKIELNSESPPSLLTFDATEQGEVYRAWESNCLLMKVRVPSDGYTMVCLHNGNYWSRDPTTDRYYPVSVKVVRA